LVGAGPALRLIGELALAADALERAGAQGNPTATLLAELAQALWASGNQTLALQRVGEAIALDGQNAEVHYVRGLMLAQRGDRPAATAEMRTVVRLANGGPLGSRAEQRLRELQHGPGGGPAPQGGPGRPR
jgi:Flp pilus assembly protein TadD